MQSLECNSASGVPEQTELQPSQTMHAGSSAREAALVLEASEHPQDQTPADSSSIPKPESSQVQAGNAALALGASEQPQEQTPADSRSSTKPDSSQAQADPQVNGQRFAAEQNSEEQSPDEVRLNTAYIDKHVNGIASPQDSGLQSSQEAEAEAVTELSCPTEAEQSSDDSTAGQADRADPAEVDSEKLDRHDDDPSMQAAEALRENGESGGEASQPAAELQEADAHASRQTGDSNTLPANGVQYPQPAGHAAAACMDFVLVPPPAESIPDEPNNTQAAEQQELPEHLLNADSATGERCAVPLMTNF